MLISIIGNRGSGKTLLLTYLSTKAKRIIYSNFKLVNIKNYRALELSDLLQLPNNIDVYLDEGYTWLESRTSMSSLNRYISYIVFQSRKRTIDIYTTAQMFSSVDIRFREQSDIIIKCNCKNSNFYYQIFIVGTNKVKNLILPYDKAQKYFKYYDTYEIIEPNQKDKLEFKIIQQNPKKLLSKVKEISKVIEPKLNVITHDTVKTALLLNGYDIGYEKYLYLYLKKLIEK